MIKSCFMSYTKILFHPRLPPTRRPGQTQGEMNYISLHDWESAHDSSLLGPDFFRLWVLGLILHRKHVFWKAFCIRVSLFISILYPNVAYILIYIESILYILILPGSYVVFVTRIAHQCNVLQSQHITYVFFNQTLPNIVITPKQ